MPKTKGNGAPDPAESFTETLRRRLVAAMDGAGGTSYRVAADEIGVPHATLWRFATGGAPSGPLVDKLVEWLGEKKR